MTLAFLGEKSGGQVSEIISKLREINSPKFSFSAKGVLLLPHDSFARVFCAKIEPSPQLLELHKKITATLSVEEGCEYRPHVTLARLKGRRNLEKLVELKNALAEKDFGTGEIASFYLKKSVLSQQGPEYGELARFPL